MFGTALGALGASGGAGLGFALGGTLGLQTATSLYNIYQQERQYDYQKDLQQDIFSREDSAIQRRVADLKAAGLSPVLAAGQGAGAGQVVSTTAPQADDLAGKYAQLIKMKNDIAISKTQQELMEEQKYAATASAVNSLSSADSNMATIRQKNHDLRIYSKWGMPSNAGSDLQKIGFLKGAVSDLGDKMRPDPQTVYPVSKKGKGETERSYQQRIRIEQRERAERDALNQKYK